MAKTIEIEEHVTVGTLADKLDLPVTKLIAELMKNGVMATVNERIDFDTASIIVDELELEDVKLKRKSVDSEPVKRQKRKSKAVGETRPPVVAVMGHVDHGKTSLLDAIRESNKVKSEAGGITQHISAYQITHNKRQITFLDTPGHEAFSALREHGAQLTDLVIIVVAADDGVKPQTIEAIRFAQKAGVNILVAINKIDKEGADTNLVKQQLSEQKLMPEEWGGDTVIVEVSAKNKTGIDKLLDMVLLIADVEELKADAVAPARGLIIEAHMEKGRGPVAVTLVEEGTLKSGDSIVAGSTFAKVRSMESTLGKAIKEAGPSTPVVISGFKELPNFADEFEAVATEKLAKTKAEKNKLGMRDQASRSDLSGSELISIINKSRELKELNVILKADVQGSLTSVADSLKTLNTDEVATRIVSSGVGAVSENDLHLAHTSKAIIYGFNINLPQSIKQLANRDKVSIRLYKVIYELIDDVKEDLSKLLAPEVIETELGRLRVKAVFKTTRSEVICGGEVTKGKLVAPSRARVTRDKEQIADVEVTNLKRGPQDTKEVLEGEMCGVNLKTETKLSVLEGDNIEFYSQEIQTRTL